MTVSEADKELEKLGHVKVKEGPITVTYNTTYYPKEGEPKEDWSIKIDKELNEVSFAKNTATIKELKAIIDKWSELKTREEKLEDFFREVIEEYGIDMEIKNHIIKMTDGEKTNKVDVYDIGNIYMPTELINAIYIFDRNDQIIGYYDLDSQEKIKRGRKRNKTK